ncbi:MAG: hypothetical protein RL518_814 [Pseudomonadota bacterium]|jgi:hypothetical protein
MKIRSLIVAATLAIGFVSEGFADDAMLRVKALRAARKMARGAVSSEVSAMKNSNFQGIWGGRYFYAPRNSSCSTRVASFDFRHVFLTKGGAGYLSTNHDGNFNGRSRDKGRRWQFAKGITVGGRPGVLAVVYQSLAKNGNSAATGAAISITGGCIVSYGANAVRLAR